MSDKYTIRNGMVFGINGNGAGTDIPGLVALIRDEPSFICNLLNLAYVSGQTSGIAMARTIMKSDTIEALDGAIDKLLDSGDLDIDDEPAPDNGQSRRTRLATEANWPPRDGGGK